MTVLRIKLSPEEGARLLDDIVASTGVPHEWWSMVARRFLELYEPATYGKGVPLSRPEPRPTPPPNLQSSALAIRDILDAVEEYLGGRDLFEECSNVERITTMDGTDYDCRGCKACGLHYEMQAAEKFITRIDEHLDLDEGSRSRQDVPIQTP